jgi:hypothetical protein
MNSDYTSKMGNAFGFNNNNLDLKNIYLEKYPMVELEENVMINFF